MKLTDAMRSWAHTNKGVEEDADDSAVRKAITLALFDETLDNETFVQLSKEADADDALSFEKKLDTLVAMAKTQDERLSAIESAPTKKPTAKASAPQIAGMSGKLAAGQSDDAGDVTVNVIPAHKQYASEAKAAYYPEHTNTGSKHVLAGQRVGENGVVKRYVDEPSELSHAICGAFFKLMMVRSNGGLHKLPSVLHPTDHDKELLQYAVRNCKWAGVLGGECERDRGAVAVHNRHLTPAEQKAAFNDSTSGGENIVPIEWDNNVILTPYLFGEFFPFVNVVNITRGRDIESGSVAQVTFSSGGVDGTAIPLFNTANFISAFNTTIFVANGSIELGLDFLSDSPVDLGSIVTQMYGQALLEWLDDQVCVGDGTTEPEGIINASGVTDLTPAGGAGAAAQVGDYEALLFQVPKQYRQGFATNRIRYGGTETSYQRARGIAVGATDARRVFGMDHENYMLLGHPYGINGSLTNAQLLFANFARYRMYRRLGLVLATETGGKELVRNNFMLITARARYGGQLEDSSAAAISTNAQA